MSGHIEHIDNYNLPVIATRDIVAFPHISVEFDAASEQNRAAAEAALSANNLVFIVSARPENEFTTEKFHAVGTISRISATKTEDDEMHISAEGLLRASLISAENVGAYYRAEVVAKIAMLSGANTRAEAYARQARAAYKKIASFFPRMSDEITQAVESIEDISLLADYLAANVMVRQEDKQKMLEIYDPMKRIELAVTLLYREAELLEYEFDIHKKVHARISDGQRERYLREQLATIKEELGDFDDVDEYLAKIAAADLPAEIAEKLLRENERMAKSPFGSAEAGVLRNYLDVCLELPWKKATLDRTDIPYAKKVLEADHDGMEKVKERILQYLAVKKLTPELRNQIICLVGPPGTGKTSIARSIAKAMNRKYVRVSLGGVHDEADIRGHRKTYVGAMPGRIIDALTRAGVKNPLMLLDEIDKVGKDSRGDPTSALLEVLDPEQNKFFRDHFVELPFDLSDCLFICTANTLDTIPRPLIDRMEIIELTSYTRREKLMIAKNHLIKKQAKRHGLDGRRLRFTDEAVYELIDYYTRESGVRNLEREIAAVCRHAAMTIVDGEVKRIVVTPDTVGKMLGARKVMPEKLATENEIGVVNGLAYTEVGGDLLKIEAAVLEGTGKIELTGSLGDVMKESARTAISYIRSIAREYGIDPDFYKKNDLHLHFPEGAVPKDGPSAGIAIVTATVSALTGRAVHRDIAMTGEVTLRGRVLAIGGLREKTMAAYAAGIKRVIIPADNLCNLPDIDPEARENLEFIPVRSAAEVLSAALCHVIKQSERPLPERKTADILMEKTSKGDNCRA